MKPVGAATALQRSWHLGACYLLITIALATKRPDAFSYPQFWAEDGTAWFADAYNLGFVPAIFKPHAGYLHLFCRLIGGLSTLLPLAYVPLLMNSVAVMVQALPAWFLLTQRPASWIPDLRLRIIAATLYCFLPNTWKRRAT